MAKRGRPRKVKDVDNSPGSGHNGCPQPEMTNDQLQCLFYQHRDAYAVALARKKEGDAAFKNVCKLAKAELGKSAVADFKLAIELATPEGEKIVKERLLAQARILRWMGLPLGTQESFFPEETDLTPATDRARAEGKRAGLAGEPCAPPYDPSVPQYNAWIDGWQEGQAVLVSTKLKPFPDLGDDDADIPDYRRARVSEDVRALFTQGDDPEDSAERRRRRYEEDEAAE